MIQQFLNETDVPWVVQIMVGAGVAVGAWFVLRAVFRHEKLRSFLGKHVLLSLLTASCVQFCQLEIADHNVFFTNMSLLNIGINILTLFLFLVLLYAVTNRGWLSLILLEIVVTVLGIANYYTLHFRGTPVTAQDIPSIQTAFNVSSDLEFTLEIVAVFLAVVAAVCIEYALFLKKYEEIRKGQYWKRGLKILVSLVILWFLYFCEYSPKPANTSAWIWRDQYWNYGYAACSFESVQRAVNIIEKPEGYTASAALDKMNEAMAEEEAELSA